MDYKTTKKFMDDEDIAVLKRKKMFFTIILGVIVFMSLVMAAVVVTILSQMAGAIISLIAVAVFFGIEAVVIKFLHKFMIKPFVLDLTAGEKIIHEGIITNLREERIVRGSGETGSGLNKYSHTVSFGEVHILIERTDFYNLKVGAKCVIHVAPNSSAILKCSSS